jgi:hypothetical protein
MHPTRIELDPTARVEVVDGRGSRRRNVLKGELLVRPIKRLLYRDPYLGECELDPERDRLSPTHWVVRARPEWFMPCMKGDQVTASQMRALLRSAEMRERREIARARRPGRRAHILPPPPPREPWRLP